MFHAWGKLDQQSGRISPALLLNAQNFFDATIGDVAGAVECRFFIIELKRERVGFPAEVDSKQKSYKFDRGQLLKTLNANRNSRELSVAGHWGAYGDEKSNFNFEPYYKAVSQSSDWIDNKLYSSQNRCPIEFKHFYEELHRGEDLNGAKNLFRVGIGLPILSFREYIKIMYEHNPLFLKPALAAQAENEASRIAWEELKKINSNALEPKKVEVFGLNVKTGQINLTQATPAVIYAALEKHLNKARDVNLLGELEKRVAPETKKVFPSNDLLGRNGKNFGSSKTNP